MINKTKVSAKIIDAVNKSIFFKRFKIQTIAAGFVFICGAFILAISIKTNDTFYIYMPIAMMVFSAALPIFYFYTSRFLAKMQFKKESLSNEEIIIEYEFCEDCIIAKSTSLFLDEIPMTPILFKQVIVSKDYFILILKNLSFYLIEKDKNAQDIQSYFKKRIKKVRLEKKRN